MTKYGNFCTSSRMKNYFLLVHLVHIADRLKKVLQYFKILLEFIEENVNREGNIVTKIKTKQLSNVHKMKWGEYKTSSHWQNCILHSVWTLMLCQRMMEN